MRSCKEYVLDDVMAIVAIPIENITTVDVNSPANRLAPIISENAISSDMLRGAMTIGLQAVSAGGIVIPIKRASGKAKDDESDNVSGRLHTVTVNCEVDDREAEIWPHLLSLERTNCHLLLTFRDNTRAFVAATKDTYICNTERDGSKTSLTFRIQNLLGVQILA